MVLLPRARAFQDATTAARKRLSG